MERLHRRRFLSTLLAGAGAVGILPVGFPTVSGADRGNGSRFAYLHERDPFYPGLHFPKLTTPMWVGESGVDAVVMLSADDMGRKKAEGPTRLYSYHAQQDLNPEVYRDALRAISDRLKQIDGRSPITIFTNQAEPDDPLLPQLLREGFSIDAHAVTHPVPLMRTDSVGPVSRASLELVVRDFLDCIANLKQIPNNRPVAFRIPGCDARNVVSPRFFSEVFPLRTPDGDFLAADSSIFMVFTSEDPSLPREWVLHPDGRERFVKYLHGMPSCKHYANCVFNYPYPYVIDRLIWELPPLMPADSNGLHLHKANSPLTVEDWERALDLVVRKQGLMVICFHPETPHGYMKGDMLAQLVDYADRRYGRRVKFLNAREIHERLTHNLLDGEPLRSRTGNDNGVRLADVNGDGFLDVIIGNSRMRRTKIWQPELGTWKVTSLPVSLVAGEDTQRPVPTGVRFFTASRSGHAGLLVATPKEHGVWHFDGSRWAPAAWKLPKQINGQPIYTSRNGLDRGVHFRDLNGDGFSDLIVNNESQNAVFLWRPSRGEWKEASFRLPQTGVIVDARGWDQGLRFVDINGDGMEDIVLSNERECWIYLFEDLSHGWSKRLLKGAGGEIPPIVYGDAINGVWFHSDALVHANEFTQKGDSGWSFRISFKELLERGKLRKP